MNQGLVIEQEEDGVRRTGWSLQNWMSLCRSGRFRGVFALGSSVSLSLVSLACAKPPSITPAQMGKGLYEVNCAICHGSTGAGDGPVGENLTPKPSRLNDAVLASRPDDLIFKSIKSGVMRDGRQTMPPAKDLTDAQISQLVAYLRTLPRE